MPAGASAASFPLREARLNCDQEPLRQAMVLCHPVNTVPQPNRYLGLAHCGACLQA